MKRLLLTFFVLPILFLPISSYAVQDDLSSEAFYGSFCIKTYTSEPCGVGGEEGWSVGPSDQTARYVCSVCGPNAFIEFLSSIYKYVFFISLIVGVLMMVILGIWISISGVSTEDLKTAAKQKMWAIFWGLMAMALIPWILKTVAPFFFK